MSAKKTIISRLETLITEYVGANGIDSNVSKMTKILDVYKSTEKISFYDFAVISGILKVSPDYIIGITDDRTPEDGLLVRLLSSAARLNHESLVALCRKSESFLDIQENLIDYDQAGIVISEYSTEGDLISQTFPREPNEYSMFAEEKNKYKNDEE